MLQVMAVKGRLPVARPGAALWGYAAPWPPALLTESVYGQDRSSLVSQQHVLLAGGNLACLAAERCLSNGRSATDVSHRCPWF